MIGGHLEIADGTTISGATPVFSSIEQAGIYTGTFPTLPHREWLRMGTGMRRLRDIEERLRRLEREAEVQAHDPTGAQGEGER